MDDDTARLIDEVTHRTLWQAQSACKGKGPDLFFPERGGSVDAAKKLCAGCAVHRPCLEAALADPGTLGISGGVSDHGRRVLRLARVA